MVKNEPENTTHVMLDVSWSAIARLFGLILLILLISHVWHFLLLLVLSIFVAVTLEPVEAWLNARGLSRQSAMILISIGTVSIAVASLVFLVPPLINEMGSLSDSLPALRSEIVQNAPTKFGVNRMFEQLLSARIDTTKIIEGALSFGQQAMSATIDVLMLLVFSLYFLIDGPRAYRWLLPYFSAKNQRRISATVDEILEVVSAYISGQLLTSIMATIFSLSVLTALRVPAALSLSLLAGVFDVLPVIGFFLFIVPACLLAMTISWKTSLLLLAIYTAYHLVEAYIIIPRVYGVRMRLSALVILIGIVIAYSTAGVLGAIAILPLLASYPIVERIWLARHVGPAAVEEHKAVPTEVAT